MKATRANSSEDCGSHCLFIWFYFLEFLKVLQSKKKKAIKPLVFKYHSNSLYIFFHFIYLLCGTGDWAQSLNKFRFLPKTITSVKPLEARWNAVPWELLSLAAQGKDGMWWHTSVHICNPSTQEAGTGGSAWIQGQSGLRSKTELKDKTARHSKWTTWAHTFNYCSLLFIRELKPDPNDSLFHFGFNALPTSIPDSYRNERQTLCARWHTLTLWDCLQRIPVDDWMGFCVQNASSLLTEE